MRSVVLALAVAGFLCPAQAQAQDVSATAFLDRAEVGLGQAFVLNVEVSGSRRLEQDPELPDVSAFATFLGSSTQTSMQITNGRTTVSLIIQYRFQSTAEGTFEIGPVMIRAAGQALATDPLTVRVSADPRPPPGTGDAGGAGPDAPLVGPQDLYVVAEPNKRQVRENEPVIVEYRLYTRVNVGSYGVTQLPATTGFWVEEFELPQQPQVEQVVRDGEAYATAVIRKVALYPTGPGTKTLEPIGIEVQVRVQRRSRDPFGDLFGSFFDRGSLLGDVVSAAAASRPVEIEVLPLPAAGRPEAFSGLVGHLEIASSVDRDSVATNEAVTLRVELVGDGNLKALPPPDLVFPPTVEAFPPEVSDRLRTTNRGVTGSRTYEYVLIPRAPGTLTVPGVDVGYYETSADQYRMASAAPLKLRVTGHAVENTLPGARARTDIEELRTDIRFIRIDTPRFRRRGDTLFSHAWFWLALLTPVGAIGGAASLRRRRDRLASDQAYARDRRAGRLARKRLSRARELASGDDARAFYAETAQALEGFLADKLDVSAAGLIRDDLRSALSRRGVDDAAVDEYLDLLDTCDRRRFAPGADQPSERHALLQRAETVVGRLARGLGR